MTEYVVIAIVATAGSVLVLARLYLKTLVKTSVQESIKHEFEVQRERMRQEFEREQSALERKDSFRLAALDKRLQSHQAAYSLALEMFRNTHSDQPTKRTIVVKCEEFWENNSLYLSHEVREAFLKAVYLFRDYYIYLDRWENSSDDVVARKKLEETFRKLSDLPGVIERETDASAAPSQFKPFDLDITPDKTTPRIQPSQ